MTARPVPTMGPHWPINSVSHDGRVANQGRWPTDTGNGLSLVHKLLAKEVSFADDEDGESCTTKHRNDSDTQKEPDHVVDTPHLALCGTIGAGNRLVNPLLRIHITEPPYPTELEDLVRHGSKPYQSVDAARSCEERGRAEGELVRRRNDVDVAGRVSSHRRVRTVVFGAAEATQGLFVGELGRLVRDWVAVVIERALGCAYPVKLDCQAQEACVI